MSNTYKLVDKIVIFREKEKNSLGYVIPYITTQKGEANSYTKNRMDKARYWIKRSKETVEEVVENSFIQGFKVVGYTSRPRTGNKLMEISDPRGFLFQIYISDFLNLLKDVTIEKGEIKDKCQWGWAEATGHCMLIPESGNILKQSIKNEEKKELIKPLKASEVQVGDWVTLDKDGYGGYVLYLGKLSLEGFLNVNWANNFHGRRDSVTSYLSQSTELIPTFVRVRGYCEDEFGNVEKKNSFEIFQKKTMRVFSKKNIKDIKIISGNSKKIWCDEVEFNSSYLVDKFLGKEIKYFHDSDRFLIENVGRWYRDTKLIKCSLKDKSGNLFNLDNYKEEIMRNV